VLDIKEDPRFERHGDDLVYDLGITFTQAALGAEVKVPTPVRRDDAARRAGDADRHGVPAARQRAAAPRRKAGHGDLHVRIHVWTPNKLTAEQRKLLETLSEIEDEPPQEEEGSKFWDTIRRALGWRSISSRLPDAGTVEGTSERRLHFL